MPAKLFVAVPVYGSISTATAQCLLKFVQERLPGASIVLRISAGDSLISRARNVLTADFLATDCTHLLFIDSDLIFSGEQIARLLSHDDEPIVGGFYPKKQPGNLEWVCNAHLNFPPPNKKGLQSLRYIGTGFLMVKREVFETMIQDYDLSYTADGTGRLEHDFWSVGVWTGEDGSRRYLSEDWFFCQRALDLGYEVMGDTRVILKHIGQSIYPQKDQEGDIIVKLPDSRDFDLYRLGLQIVPAGMHKHVHRIFKGEYDPKLDGWSPETILDIGANIGAFTVWACQKWPTATVQAYEPHPLNCDVFLRNTERYHQLGAPPWRVALTEAAVRYAGGHATLTEGGNCGEHSFHFPPRSKYAKKSTKLEVNCIAASTLPSCEFVKIDTEGSEIEIIQGLDLTKTRVIAVEYHRANDRKLIQTHLKPHGFKEISHKAYAKHRGVLKFVRS